MWRNHGDLIQFDRDSIKKTRYAKALEALLSDAIASRNLSKAFRSQRRNIISPTTALIAFNSILAAKLSIRCFN